MVVIVAVVKRIKKPSNNNITQNKSIETLIRNRIMENHSAEPFGSDTKLKLHLQDYSLDQLPK
jgi:hypothetical protein